MVELGLPAAEAVAAVRKARPGAIETEAQLAFVLAQTSVPEPVPATTEAAIRDRARGALLGLAVGDAVGTTLEGAVRLMRTSLRFPNPTRVSGRE
jgi:ADP-ribosyl-[dinitrogen reductase] hydrolase